jgi:leucyl aminopeptidase
LGDRDNFGCGQKRSRVAARPLADWPRRNANGSPSAWATGGPSVVSKRAFAVRLAGCHGQDLYRREKNCHPFDEILWNDGYQAVLTAGQILGETVNLTRQLVNEPPSRIYPESFAAEAEKFAEEFGWESKSGTSSVWRRNGAGRCWAWRAGSARPPRLVILSHRGGAEGDPPGAGRQRRHLRLGRIVDQAVRGHADHEVRHGRRGDRASAPCRPSRGSSCRST